MLLIFNKALKNGVPHITGPKSHPAQGSLSGAGKTTHSDRLLKQWNTGFIPQFTTKQVG